MDRGAQRGGGALPRVQPHQAAPAPLQHPAQGRQVLPVPRDHPRRGVAAGDGDAGRQAQGRPLLRALRPRLRDPRDPRPPAAHFPIRTCTKNKFDRHHRLGRPCLYAHIEKCAGAVRRRGHRRGVRGLWSPSSRLPRRRHRRRSSTGSTSRCTRPATRSSSSGRHACATRSCRCARRSSASRWSTPARRTTTPSASPTTRSRRRVQVFLVRKGRVVGRKGLVVDKVEDVGRPELVGRLLEQLYGDARGRRHPARDPGARRTR